MDYPRNLIDRQGLTNHELTTVSTDGTSQTTGSGSVRHNNNDGEGGTVIPRRSNDDPTMQRCSDAAMQRFKCARLCHDTTSAPLHRCQLATISHYLALSRTHCFARFARPRLPSVSFNSGAAPDCRSVGSGRLTDTHTTTVALCILQVTSSRAITPFAERPKLGRRS